MASYGIATGSAGIVEGLSADAKTLIFDKKVTVRSGTGFSTVGAPLARYDFTCDGFPVIFVAQDTATYPLSNTGLCPTRICGLEKSGNNYKLWVEYPRGISNTADYNHYYIFKQTTAASTATWGIRTWDADGEVSYDTGYKPLHIKRIVTFTTAEAQLASKTKSYGPTLTKPAYLARMSEGSYGSANTYRQIAGVNYGYASFSSNAPFYSFRESASGNGQFNSSYWITGYKASYYVFASDWEAQTWNQLKAAGIDVSVSGGTLLSNWSDVNPVAFQTHFIEASDYD
jgi:hypothetical protein